MGSRINSRIDTDVAVIGGGLAGLSTALAITARSDAWLTLFEPSVGSNRSLPLTFYDTLERFGLSDCIIKRYHRFALRARTGEQAVCALNEAIFATLDYSGACMALYRRLQDRPNVSHQEARVSAVIQEHGVWRIQAAKQEFTARLLIDASGLTQQSQRIDYRRPRLYSHSYGQILDCDGLSEEQQDTALFLTGNPDHGNGGGWFYPLPDGRASFGFAQVTRSPRYPRRRCIQGYERALREFEPYHRLLHKGRIVPTHWGTIPLGTLRRFCHNGLMRVGDAAGQATSWACMGIEPALVNGELCGEIAARALHEGNLSARRLREYERRWRYQHHVAYRKATMLADLEWNRGERAWQDIVRWTATLSPEEMLSNVRYNTPHISLPVIWWLLVYDRLGLARRALRNRFLQSAGAGA
ncbi:MAG TPA: hypothetical protein GX702_16120 [Chloroflexi bacterium]|jgi:digeranylgeranylglycerophospholipid reductase|nr:hypothetical protein [Chloroflexota bacterium]